MPDKEDFVKRDQFSTFLQEGVDKVIKSGYNDINSEIVSSSEVTQCDRRIYYSLVGVDQLKKQSIRIHKKALIHKWSSILGKIKGFELVGTGVTVADHNHSVTADIDVVGKLHDRPVAIMVVEVDDETFQNDKAVRKHVVDIMSQMWMAEVNDGFLVYENILSKKFSMFHILPNVSVLNAVKQKLKGLQEKKMLGILPDRKYEAFAKECRECRFTERCWR
jgi:hypothetical protein